MKKGFTLIEIMVVISVFAVLSVLVTRSVMVTIRGSKKSESQIKVRENVNYAFSVMERQLRSAQKILSCSADEPLEILYTDDNGQPADFTCEEGYIASSSARLTSSDINVDYCSITCQQNSVNDPPIVTINVSASENSSTGVEIGTITMKTEIVGRNY